MVGPGMGAGKKTPAPPQQKRRGSQKPRPESSQLPAHRTKSSAGSLHAPGWPSAPLAATRTQIFPGALPVSVPLDRVEESAYFHSALVSGLTRLLCKRYTLTPLTGPHTLQGDLNIAAFCTAESTCSN